MNSKKVIPCSLFIFFSMTLFSCHVKKTIVKNSPASLPSGVTRPGKSNSAYNEDVSAYIKKYSLYAVKEMQESGVPASVILAQGIHESSAGKSLLSQEANNHFGVKCTGDWSGPSYRMNDDQPNECFRKYANAGESFDDHIKFLQRKRYASLFTLDKKDYKGWASGLKRCGYATNPRYAELLVSMIERYNLDRFDQGSAADAPVYLASRSTTNHSAPQEASVAENVHQPVLVTASVLAGRSAKGTIRDTIHQKVYIIDTIYQYAYQHPAYTAARKPSAPAVRDSDAAAPRADSAASILPRPAGNSYTVKKGDTLYGIAHRFNLKMDDLIRLNSLLEGKVRIDQILQLR